MRWLLLFCLSGMILATDEYLFRNTDHQLQIIRLTGEKPGATVLVFGGIHGDEPGGHFSPEILSQIKLHKGQLIIVPRVNFPSIMLNRRELYGDMNRKFISARNSRDPENEVVEVLKKLMAEADIFVNLHDAMGFHREKYLSRLYNPNMYGQSLIVDADRFFSKKMNREINLNEIGSRIVVAVNRQIPDEKHHFGFWNHYSINADTKFPEMKKSATHFALTTFSIPAFGVETSKDLPSLADKVKYQLLVLREILSAFELEFDFPPLTVSSPSLYWVEIKKNGHDEIRINDNSNLRLLPGDRVTIMNVHANYSDGLSADILGFGSLNDIGREFVFQNATSVVIKKNNIIIGRVYLKPFEADSLRAIHCTVDGREVILPNWGKIDLADGQQLKLLKTDPNSAGLLLEIKGWQTLTARGNEGFTPIAATSLAADFSFLHTGSIYFARLYQRKRLIGGFQIEYTHATGNK